MSGLDNKTLDVYKFFQKWGKGNPDSEINARRMFIPRKGRQLVSVDYSQLEVCVLFHYIGNTADVRLSSYWRGCS